MSEEKLIELLILVEGVRSNSWNMVMSLVDFIKADENNVNILRKSWADEWKQSRPEMYPLDLSKIETWSTYDGECIDIRFSIKDGELNCSVKIYDGRLLNGYRESLRFTFDSILKKSFITRLTSYIDSRFETYLNNEYDEYLESQKQLWIDNLRTKILS